MAGEKMDVERSLRFEEATYRRRSRHVIGFTSKALATSAAARRSADQPGRSPTKIVGKNMKGQKEVLPKGVMDTPKLIEPWLFCRFISIPGRFN